MEIKLQDYYGQYIKIHDNTSSGNVRFVVKTQPDMNKVRTTPEDECTLETDISLNENHLDILIGALSELRRNM